MTVDGLYWDEAGRADVGMIEPGDTVYCICRGADGLFSVSSGVCVDPPVRFIDFGDGAQFLGVASTVEPSALRRFGLVGSVFVSRRAADRRAAERGTGRRKMRRGIAADAPLSDAGEERLSEEDRRALKMIEELFPGEYRAAKREVAAAIASDAPSSLGGLAAILSQRGNPDGAVLAGRIVEALLTDKATLMDAASMLYFSDGKVVDVW